MSGSRKYSLSNLPRHIDPRIYDELETEVQVTELTRLRADNARMRAALLVISEAQVGGGSFRAASYDVATTDITADILRARFA